MEEIWQQHPQNVQFPGHVVQDLLYPPLKYSKSSSDWGLAGNKAILLLCNPYILYTFTPY